MASEREIKLRVENVETLKNALQGISAKPVGPGGGRVHEWNTVFDTAGQELTKKGQLLRIRKVTQQNGGGKPKFLFTLKRPSEREERDGYGHKVREEIETEVGDGEALKRMLEGLGMNAWFSYEKYRTTMKLPGADLWAARLVIELDETPIGTFLELEGPAEAIDQAARELGYSRQDYITTSYLGLYFEECRRRGQPPGNMVFDQTK